MPPPQYQFHKLKINYLLSFSIGHEEGTFGVTDMHYNMASQYQYCYQQYHRQLTTTVTLLPSYNPVYYQVEMQLTVACQG